MSREVRGEATPSSLHVLMVASEEYVPRHSPLSGVFERDQALALRDLGHRVGMISVRLEAAPVWRVRNALARLRGRGIDRPAGQAFPASVLAALRNPVVSLSDEDGIAVVRAVATPLGFSTSAGWLRSWSRAAAAAYARYLATCGRPDVLHVHNALPGGSFSARSAAASPPLVITEHSSRYSRERLDPALFEAAREAYGSAQAVIAVSPSLGRRLQELSLTEVSHVIPNIVPGAFDAPPSQPPATPPFRFVSIGSLDENKGQRHLLSALARLDDSVHVDIIGDGPLRADLERQIVELRLQGRTRLLGRLPRVEVAEVLQQSHALVVTSRVETFGVAAIEALATGRPVVATRSGGPESVIDEANGVLVDPDSVDDLERGLRDVIDHYPRYEPDAIRRACRERYAPEVVARQLEAVYRSRLDDTAVGADERTR